VHVASALDRRGVCTFDMYVDHGGIVVDGTMIVPREERP
jgi:hypothetical protein